MVAGFLPATIVCCIERRECMKAISMAKSIVSLTTGISHTDPFQIEDYPNHSKLLNKKTKIGFYQTEMGHHSKFYLPLMGYAIITNRRHTGIWLIVDTEQDAVVFPGGPVLADMYDEYIGELPGEIVTDAIANQMVQLFTMNSIDSSWLFHKYPFPIHRLNYVLKEYGFESSTIYKELFYEFPSIQDTLNFYRLIEVPDPIDEYPPFSSGCNTNHRIWYSKKTHESLLRCRMDYADMLNSDYNQDIRTDEGWLKTISKIFDREDLFGKYNAY